MTPTPSTLITLHSASAGPLAKFTLSTTTVPTLTQVLEWLREPEDSPTRDSSIISEWRSGGERPVMDMYLQIKVRVTLAGRNSWQDVQISTDNVENPHCLEP